jgi:hypothetical protein
LPIVATLTLLIQLCFICHVIRTRRAQLEAILEHARRFRIRHEEEQEWVAAAGRGLAG